MHLTKALRYVLTHPLNRDCRVQALRRYARWQIGSRLLPGAVVMPFVNDTRLFARRGLTAATLNVYTGLSEFPEMAFLLHLLRPEDLLVDVGANIGAYTVLASAAIGTRTIALEPAPETFEHLVDNIRLNRMETRVEAINVAVGREPGSVRFVLERLNAVSHVLADGEAAPADATVIDVPARPLDDIVGSAKPFAIKIDVEGFETEVVAAQKTFSDPDLRAVLMETNSLARRYGFDEEGPHRTMLELGFAPHVYDPWERRLIPVHGTEDMDDNTLYLRNVEAVEERLKTAPPFTVNGREV